MARIRTVKPSLWEDEGLGACSRDARLLYIGLMTKMADDHGQFRAAPALVRAALLPYDEVNLLDVAAWLGELAEARLVELYSVDGERFGRFPPDSWNRHQRIDQRAKPQIPPPPGAQASLLDEPAAAPPARRPAARARDEVWDTLAAMFGSPTNDDSRGRRNRVVRLLKQSGATPDEIHYRAREFTRRWSVPLTDTALAKRWDDLGAPVVAGAGRSGAPHRVDEQVARLLGADQRPRIVETHVWPVEVEAAA